MFNFTAMKATIILVAAIQGLLIVPGLILKKVRNRPPQIYLGLLILVFALEMLFAWGGLTGYNNRAGRIPFWLLKSYLMIPPALWLFFRHQFVPDFTFQRRQLVLFIPALFEILLSSLNYFLKVSFLRPVGFTVWLVLVDWLPLSLTVLVLAAYSKNLVASLRETKESQRAHLWKMLMVLVVFWLMAIIWAAESIFGFDLHILFQTSTAVILFSLAYAAYFDPAFFERAQPAQQKRPSEFSSYDDPIELARLKVLLEQDAIYKRPRLTLSQLGAELSLPGKYVSYLINRYQGCNFNDFVNGYRVNEVLRRIPLERHKTLVGIALDAGFSSRSTFQQVFRQHTGKSPSEFLPKTSEIAIPDV